MLAARGPAALPHISEVQTFRIGSNSLIYTTSPAKSSTAELDLRLCASAHRAGIHAGALGRVRGAAGAQAMRVVAAVWLPL